MKKHLSKILINLIITLFLEVIVFNITSYRVLLGNFEKRTYTEFELEQYDDSRAILKIDNINTILNFIKCMWKKTALIIY